MKRRFMGISNTERVKKHRELRKSLGYGACSVTAPVEHHKTLQALGKLLMQDNATAQGIMGSVADFLDEKPYTPYLSPLTEPYEPPETPIEPAVLKALSTIAIELGAVKDADLVERLERQIRITIDAHQAKAQKAVRKAMR